MVSIAGKSDESANRMLTGSFVVHDKVWYFWYG